MAATMQTIADIIADSFDLPVRKTAITKEKFVNGFARLTQFMAWPLIFVAFNFFYDLDIHGAENFRKVKKPFIIVSNHVDFYHSFVFRLVLGLFSPHLPLRFMAATGFDWSLLNLLRSIGVIDLIYSLFGVFTIVPGLGMEKNLRKAKEIIRSGGNIVIYPEGKVYTGIGIGPFKKGAAVLMKETGSSVVPVAFRLGRRNFWWRKLTVNVGKPLNVSANNSVGKITEIFHKEVERLYESVKINPNFLSFLETFFTVS